MGSSLFICQINEIIEPRLLAISKQKTNDALKMLTHKVLQTMDYENTNFFKYNFDNKGNIVSVEYDTKALNDLLSQSLTTLENSLESARLGKEDPLLEEVFFEDGIVYEVPIGYFTGIAFLQNWGYRLKIEMPLFHYVNGSLSIESEEYGVNSSLIKIVLNLKINAEVITTIYIEEIMFEESIPLVIQVVNGEVPSFTTDIKKD